MKKQYNLFILLFLCTFFNSCIFDKENPEPEKPDRGFTVVVGQQAPPLTITYLDGKTVSLASLKGKVVMLQFAASWCKVCQKVMPIVESRIWGKYKANPNFVLVGICKGENKDAVLKFIETSGVTYPLIPDEDASKFSLFAEKDAGVTRNVLIGKNGKIAFLTRLYQEEEFAELDKKIEELLLDTK